MLKRLLFGGIKVSGYRRELGYPGYVTSST